MLSSVKENFKVTDICIQDYKKLLIYFYFASLREGVKNGYGVCRLGGYSWGTTPPPLLLTKNCGNKSSLLGHGRLLLEVSPSFGWLREVDLPEGDDHLSNGVVL